MNKFFVLSLLLTLSFSSRAETIVMTVDGLVCAFCAQGIDKSLRKLPATADVFVSLAHKTVALALKPEQQVSDESLRQSLTESGYTLRAIERSAESLDAVRARTATP